MTALDTTLQHTAEASRDAMLKDDHATRALGIHIQAVGPGTCTATMTVRQDMLNGHATCHGGLITTLADSAFAFKHNLCTYGKKYLYKYTLDSKILRVYFYILVYFYC